MKGLKKIALVSTIAAISAGAQAELKALDDSAMGELTGQKGLTIDLETKHTIGEFAYEDAGFVVFQDLSLGNNTNATHNVNASGLLDNVRITLDVAGSGAVELTNGQPDNLMNYGNSEVVDLAKIHYGVFSNADADMFSAAGNIDAVNSAAIGERKSYGDGDLVIHFGFTDAWQYGGGLQAYLNSTGSDGAGGTASMTSVTYATARNVVRHAVDFNQSIGAIGLAATGYTVGSKSVDDATVTAATASMNLITDSTPNTTTLISDLSVNGYLGSMDISIENHGNGFGAGTGRGDADSKIHWNTFFEVTDLDVYIDIAAVQITGMTINNRRGDLTDLDGNSAVEFAQSRRTIFAVNEAVIDAARLALPEDPYVDGVAINTEFKGDMTIEALSFGDEGVSIGSLYWTDILSTTNLTIRGH